MKCNHDNTLRVNGINTPFKKEEIDRRDRDSTICCQKKSGSHTKTEQAENKKYEKKRSCRI